MFRTNLATAYLKRTVRPLYGWTQATPKSGFLDPAWNRSVAIFPGMVMTKTSGNNYTLIGSGTGTNTAQIPAGLVSQWIGGDGVDELLESGINALSVWVLGPDAEFEVLAGAFDTTQSWVDPGDGTEVLICASVSGSNQGQLVPSTASGSLSIPVAKLIQVESANALIIGGLQARVN